jgi:hypothetical protein
MPRDTSIKSVLIIGSGLSLWSSMWIWLRGITISSFHPWGRNWGYSYQFESGNNYDRSIIKPLTTKSIMKFWKHILKSMLFYLLWADNRFELVFRSRWKEFGKISGKNDRCWCKRYQHNREQRAIQNYLKKLEYHLRLQKYVLPTLEVKKLHKNLVFL